MAELTAEGLQSSLNTEAAKKAPVNTSADGSNRILPKVQVENRSRRSFLGLLGGGAVALGINKLFGDPLQKATDEAHLTGSTSVGDAVSGGISEGADRLADRFRKGIDQDPMMGEVQYDGKKYLVKFDTTIKEYPITVRRDKPSTDAEEVGVDELSKYDLDLQNGEVGVFEAGGTYPTPGGNVFEDDRGNKHGEWFRVEKINTETGKKEKLYVGVSLETERTEVPDPANSTH